MTGHLRPLIHLSARFVKLRSIVVTLLVSNGYCDRLKTELSRSFEEGDEHAKRIRRVFANIATCALGSLTRDSYTRVVAVGDIQGFSSEEFDRQFEAAWKALDAGSELVCSHTGERHSALPRPQAAILDVRPPDRESAVVLMQSCVSVEVFRCRRHQLSQSRQWGHYKDLWLAPWLDICAHQSLRAREIWRKGQSSSQG